jgi:glycosyltransferase involved in cell wall biosynthesis
MNKPPVFLVAYQCAPGSGSVSQIGWEWFTRLARRRAVLLITHARNRAAIEAAGPLPAGAQVRYIDTEWFAGPLYRLARRLFPRSEHSVFLLSQADFFLFDRLALRALRAERRRLAQRQPDARDAVVHLVTPVTLAAPSCLHKVGLPLVRGPLNCGLGDPPGFQELLMRQESRWLWPLAGLAGLFDRMLGSTSRTSALLVATRATAASVPARYRERCVSMLENAVDPAVFHPVPALPAPSRGTPLSVTYAGRLVPVKALDLLLQAVRRLQLQGIDARLDVVGDGPMRDAWQDSCRQLGIAGQVRFLGQLSQAGVARAIQDCHVFCLPSVRESGGAVLLEAMACARPVIAMDFGGPAEIVDRDVGSLVAFRDPESAVAGLTEALADCARNPDDWARRGRNARMRVLRQHTWEAKIDQAEQVYATLRA